MHSGSRLQALIVLATGGLLGYGAAAGHLRLTDRADAAPQDAKATTKAPAPAMSTRLGPAKPTVHSQPHKPATSPSRAKVRTPANRARGPAACPLHSRSTPMARPPSAATAT